MKAVYVRRLFMIISLAAIWSVVIWSVFKPSLLHAIAQNRTTFSVIAFAGILSLCFYYYVARKHPHFAIGLAVLAVGVVRSPFAASQAWYCTSIVRGLIDS